MGGFMSYQRFRNRNGLMYRTGEGQDPYGWNLLSDADKKHWEYRKEHPNTENMHMLCGDLNRMENGYLGLAGNGLGSDPEGEHRDQMLQEVADATGIDIEDCRKVLRYVFFEHR